VLQRLAYLGITNAFALLRMLPGSDRDKDAEILALRHQLAVLQRELGRQPIQPADRAWLAALLHPLPRPSLHRLRLLVRPDTIPRWHRDLLARRHAAASPDCHLQRIQRQVGAQVGGQLPALCLPRITSTLFSGHLDLQGRF
jgi:hypothetical protein